MKRPFFTVSSAVALSAVIFVVFYNTAFFKHLLLVYPISIRNVLFAASLCLTLMAVTHIVLFVFAFRFSTKPILIAAFLLSSLVSYMMNSFNIVIDHEMLVNFISTNRAEAADQVTIKMFFYFLFLGVVPSIFVARIQLEHRPIRKELILKLKWIGACLLLVLSQLLLMNRQYASFLREHKNLRAYFNPVQWIYSVGKVSTRFPGREKQLKLMGLDARIPSTDVDRELILLVIGESARSDRLSLNGYLKKTNPYLEKENLVSFTHVEACGTSTAISVPCMFSLFSRETYNDRLAQSTENFLDVLSHAGVHVLWRDNNSDSKGVAKRIPFENFRSPDTNPICDKECRDEGMLSGLQEYVEANQHGDILIVLHQMGSHGPAYYKRYPDSFEVFKPACQTNQLEECSNEEINNAYDNSLLYTDYFLSKAISFLKVNSNKFETALVFMSDHGESLGEKGVYLHGLPFFMAPEFQKRVATIFWFGPGFDDVDQTALKAVSGKNWSHANLPHTMMGLMEIETSAYNPQLDILHVSGARIIQVIREAGIGQ